MTLAFLSIAGNDTTATYNLEVSCLAGVCPPLMSPPPSPCTLTDVLSYNATTSTLTMKFTIGNNLGDIRHLERLADLCGPQGTDPDTMQFLFSVSQPPTNPPNTITKTLALPKEGKVGVLSTLSTPKNGIACSSWVQVNTGTDPLSP